MRHMELPVGDFITDALANDVPDLARELLLSNVKDEENHDLALSYIANAYGVDEKAERKRWLREAWTSHPDHTILKAMVAERAIFFVLLPFLRAHGDAGMRTVSRPTLAEMNKSTLRANSIVCKELGLSASPSLDKLRKATINWVMQPLGINTTDKI